MANNPLELHGATRAEAETLRTRTHRDSEPRGVGTGRKLTICAG